MKKQIRLGGTTLRFRNSCTGIPERVEVNCGEEESATCLMGVMLQYVLHQAVWVEGVDMKWDWAACTALSGVEGRETNKQNGLVGLQGPGARTKWTHWTRELGTSVI